MFLFLQLISVAYLKDGSVVLLSAVNILPTTDSMQSHLSLEKQGDVLTKKFFFLGDHIQKQIVENFNLNMTKKPGLQLFIAIFL